MKPWSGRVTVGPSLRGGVCTPGDGHERGGGAPAGAAGGLQGLGSGTSSGQVRWAPIPAGGPSLHAWCGSPGTEWWAGHTSSPQPYPGEITVVSFLANV